MNPRAHRRARRLLLVLVAGCVLLGVLVWEPASIYLLTRPATPAELAVIDVSHYGDGVEMTTGRMARFEDDYDLGDTPGNMRGLWQQQFVGSEVIASECHFSATGTPQLLTAWLPDGTVWFQKRYAWDGVDYTSESRFEPPWERGVENQEVGTKNLRGLSLGTVVLEHELPPRLPVSIDFFQRADLTGADLRYLDLTRFDFTGAILRDTEFEFTILEDADLSGAIALTPAQLLHTKHEGAILYPEPIELWKRSVHSRWQAHD